MSNLLSSHSLSLVQGGSPVWDGGWELSWHLCFSVPLSVSPLGLAHWKRREVGKVLLELLPSSAGFSYSGLGRSFKITLLFPGAFMGSSEFPTEPFTA